LASDVERALAFVARREGRRSMPASRWANVLSLDLGWMPPAKARDWVQRGVESALLRADGEQLRLTGDPGQVEIPRGFRPGPEPLLESAAAAPVRSAPVATRAASPVATAPGIASGSAPAGHPAAAPWSASRSPAATDGQAVPATHSKVSAAPDPFLDWLDRVATHTKRTRPRVLAEVQAAQEALGGSLSAIAALLWVAAKAGLDVREAAAATKP
jgi:hypothetical protein